MELEVLKFPDRSLRAISEPVVEITQEIRDLADNMAETMYASEGIGLAAPQVGRLLRLVVVDLSGPAERAALNVYVNPQLECLTDEQVDGEEGCLSVPDFRSMVKRCARVRLKALDLDGKPVEKVLEDLEAVCLQHECDHLDGKLFIDHLSRLKRGLYISKVKKQAKVDERD